MLGPCVQRRTTMSLHSYRMGVPVTLSGNKKGARGTGTNDGPLVSPVMGLTLLALGRKKCRSAYLAKMTAPLTLSRLTWPKGFKCTQPGLD